MWNDFIRFLFKNYTSPIAFLVGFVGSMIYNQNFTIDWLGVGLLVALIIWTVPTLIAVLFVTAKKRAKKTDN